MLFTDARKVMDATGWRPQRDAKTTLLEIYDWLDRYQQQLESILG